MSGFEQWILDWGYWAIFFGSLIEGEMIVSLAGVFAYKGLLSFSKIVIISTIATIIGEQICYNVGRFLGGRYIHKFPKFHEKIEIGFKLIHKYQILFILSCRFMYGLRTLSPFIIGAAKVDPIKFSILNVIAAIIWSIISTSIGYGGSYLGHYLGGNCSHYIEYFFVGLFLFVSLTIVSFFTKKLMDEIKKR